MTVRGFSRLEAVAWSAADAARLAKIFTGRHEEWNKKSLAPIRSKLRAYLFDRQRYSCAYCRMPINENLGNAELDHIIPMQLAPQFTYCRFNLVLACKRCNHRKSTHNTTIHTDMILLRLTACPTHERSYRWVHPFIHSYAQHITVSDGWIFRPRAGSRQGKAVITACKLFEVRDVAARTRFAAAVASLGDQAAILQLISSHDRLAAAEGIAFEFMAARPGTPYSIDEVIQAVEGVRGGKLPFSR